MAQNAIIVLYWKIYHFMDISGGLFFNMETIAYKCINCGGPLQYDPAKLKFACEYCRSDFTEEELKKHWGELDQELKQEAVEEPEAAPADADDFSANTVIYSCQNCGAEIVAEKTTAATFCIYCHSPVVLTNRLLRV